MAEGDYQKVIAVAEPGLIEARKIRNRSNEAQLLINLGNAYNITGQSQKGKELVEQGLAIARELKNLPIESYALARLGNIYRNLGDYQKTFESLQQSLKIAQELKSPPLQTLPLISLGVTYSNLGDYQKSNEYYQKALPILQQLKNRKDESITLVVIALNYFAQENPQKAIDTAQQSLVIAREIKQPFPEIYALLVMSIGYGELGNDKQAMENAEAFLSFARKVNNPIFEKLALNILGGLHRKFGRKEQAIATYQAALAIPTPTTVAGGESSSLYGLARTYRDLNQPNVAITYYKQSINGIEDVRRNLQELPTQLQNSFLQTTVDFDKVKTSDIYRQLADLLLSQGRDKEAQQVLELLKIQEIRDVARGGSATSDKPNVPLTATESKIPAASESLIALGRQISECDRTNCNQKSALNDKLTALVEKFNQDLQKIETDIRANRATDDVFFDPRKLAKAREIVKAQPGTVMIYPLVLENRLWLLMYSEGDVVKKVEVNVGQQELGETVVKFRKLVQNSGSDINEVKKIGKQLYDWLVKPLEGELKANSIKNL
ncbi:MAG TPA: tetratricopeptide repeat protein, partial [Candidatus Sericytochromatia bacterium]